MGRKHLRKRKHLFLHIAGCLIVGCWMAGCAHVSRNNEKTPLQLLMKVNDSILMGNYTAALSENNRLMEEFEGVIGDKLLFQRGIIFSHPMNREQNYSKAMDAFQEIVNRYPSSTRRTEARIWIGLLALLDRYGNDNLYLKDKAELLEWRIRAHKCKTAVIYRKNIIQNDPQIVETSNQEELQALQEEVKSLQEQIERLKKIDIEIEAEKRTVVPK